MYRHSTLIAFCTMVLFVKISAAQNCQIHPPANLHVTDITSCSAKLHWSSSGAGSKYVVQYKLYNATQWSPQIYAGSDTFYTFTNLQKGSKYNFSVKAKCTDGSVSAKKKRSCITLQCSLPQQVDIEGVNTHDVKITVTTSCAYDSLYVKLKTINGSPQLISFPSASSYTVSNLHFDSTYLFQVSTCSPILNNWTGIDTIHLPQPPNILFMIIDDGRYDLFSCNGAPAFFHTPNIDRIANEGVNFKSSFVVTSLCAPSRASIATGLFTLKTGVTVNGIHLDSSFTTIPKVLKQDGYYTAIVGKNHETFLQGSVPEFNYSLVDIGYEKFDGKKWEYNGVMKDIETEYPRTLTDTTIALINRVNQPFFIWLSPKIPHFPLKSLPSFVGQYATNVIPWPADTAKYQVNYPSYLYSRNIEYMHGEKLDTTYRHELEVIAGLDSCVGEIIKALELSGKLDNTLLIFTDDNGFMLGNHWLNEKTQAYDPSMRVPLFIRYPKWFAPLSKITNQFALNLDIAPTIYEAAGITYNEPLDGLSLKKLYDGTASRKVFYHIMIHNENAESPNKRCIRDKFFKYIHYSCSSDTVEELFDMVNDPLELTNLVNNHIYQNVLNHYRIKYDSIKVAWQDTMPDNIKACFIEDPFVLKQIFDDEEEIPQQPEIYPTLSDGSLEIYIPYPEATARLFDAVGKQQGEWHLTDTYSKINLMNLPGGIYFLNLGYEGESVTRKFILSGR